MSRLSELQVNEGSDSPVPIAVSFDGTWAKKGFTANHGTGIGISPHWKGVKTRTEIQSLFAVPTQKRMYDTRRVPAVV